MGAVEKFVPQEAEIVPARRSTIDMVQEAVLRGAPIELVSKLMDLHERFEAGMARKAFYEAKAAFKADAPDITKDMENKQYSSKYTSIGNLVNSGNKALGKHGLDAQWTIEQGEKIKVTCILSHQMGHQEKVSMCAPPDDSGKKNPIQQIKSTVTYLKLATYEAVTGLASKEANADDDGNAAGGEPEKISEEQLQELLSLADEIGVDKIRYCRFREIDSFADILASQFGRAKQDLEAKRKASANV